MTAFDDDVLREGLSVYVADDGSNAREFLIKTIETAEGWRIAGISRCFEDFLSASPEADVWLVSSAFLGLTPPEKLRREAATNPRTIVLAVTDSEDYAEMRAALRRGARDVVVCDGSVEETRSLIESHYHENKRRLDLLENQLVLSVGETPLVEQEAGSTSRGYAAMITGADGGTGKSFIAAQLAGLTAKHAGAKTCLLDLDYNCGALGSALKMSGKARRALVDLADVADELGAGHVESVLSIHVSGFYFAPAILPHHTSETGKIPAAKVVDILKDLFDVIICDVPAFVWDKDMAQIADMTYIVASPDRVSGECASRLAARLGRQCGLIVNMCDRRGAVAAKKLQEATGLELAAEIPEDPGAGRMYDTRGEILSDRVDLAVIRSLIPIAQRCRDFDELLMDRRPSLFRLGARWKRPTPP